MMKVEGLASNINVTAWASRLAVDDEGVVWFSPSFADGTAASA